MTSRLQVFPVARVPVDRDGDRTPVQIMVKSILAAGGSPELDDLVVLRLQLLLVLGEEVQVPDVVKDERVMQPLLEPLVHSFFRVAWSG